MESVATAAPKMRSTGYLLPPYIRRIFALGAVLFFSVTGVATAATFPDDCGGPNNLDYATCERLDYLVTRSDETERLVGWEVGATVFVGVAAIMLHTFGRNM